MTDIQSLVAALQHALGISVPCGQITLNMNESRLQSVETHVKQRVRVVEAVPTYELRGGRLRITTAELTNT